LIENCSGFSNGRAIKPENPEEPCLFSNLRDDSSISLHEKLEAEHGIELSYIWVKQALQGAGLVARRRKRGVHGKRRARRSLPGMLLHIDGSRHQWLQDERWYDLIVILNDATSEIYYAQLVEEESTQTVMAGLKEVIERKRVFCALYSDLAAISGQRRKWAARWTQYCGCDTVSLLRACLILVELRDMAIGCNSREWSHQHTRLNWQYVSADGRLGIGLQITAR
jgi:hypothetical protein